VDQLPAWVALVLGAAIVIVFVGGGLAYWVVGRPARGVSLWLAGILLAAFLWNQLPQLRNVIPH